MIILNYTTTISRRVRRGLIITIGIGTETITIITIITPTIITTITLTAAAISSSHTTTPITTNWTLLHTLVAVVIALAAIATTVAIIINQKQTLHLQTIQRSPSVKSYQNTSDWRSNLALEVYFLMSWIATRLICKIRNRKHRI